MTSPFASASELAGLIASKSVSSEALTELYLSRIGAHNPALQAVIVPNAEDARRTARERDADLARGAAPGLLHGVPIIVTARIGAASEKWYTVSASRRTLRCSGTATKALRTPPPQAERPS